MLETAASDRRNLVFTLTISTAMVIVGIGLAIAVHPAWAIVAGLAVPTYWLLRRGVRRRRAVLKKSFPEHFRAILNADVAFYASLKMKQKTRFENMMKVFLDEVAITGINTEVDDQTRVLVAASAVIPIFGFDDFEYSGLGEVLIYPNHFNHDYNAVDADDRNILGMVGDRHLSGTMILSKPSLITGFRNRSSKQNVGIHEFAHLIDKQDGNIDGVPAMIPHDTIEPWVQWVGNELKRDGSFADINDYAYTNEAEYFAVLSEYFFNDPAHLQDNHPELYAMMRRMYHQDTKRVLGTKKKRRRRTRRNDLCPCGSGEKYKNCCRLKRMAG